MLAMLKMSGDNIKQANDEQGDRQDKPGDRDRHQICSRQVKTDRSRVMSLHNTADTVCLWTRLISRYIIGDRCYITVS